MFSAHLKDFFLPDLELGVACCLLDSLTKRVARVNKSLTHPFFECFVDLLVQCERTFNVAVHRKHRVNPHTTSFVCSNMVESEVEYFKTLKKSFG